MPLHGHVQKLPVPGGPARPQTRRAGREVDPGWQKCAKSSLVIADHLIREGGVYKDRGAGYCDGLDKARLERHHVRRLEQLAYTVTVAPAAAAQPPTQNYFTEEPVQGCAQ